MPHDQGIVDSTDLSDYEAIEATVVVESKHPYDDDSNDDEYDYGDDGDYYYYDDRYDYDYGGYCYY